MGYLVTKFDNLHTKKRPRGRFFCFWEYFFRLVWTGIVTIKNRLDAHCILPELTQEYGIT